MDGSLFLGSKKKHKPNAVSQSMIENIPVHVLLHVLSFLPMKDAVRTSILAKSWEFLWTFLPKLEFKEDESKSRTLFLNFIERAMVLRDMSPLQTFSLGCEVRSAAPRVGSWITFAVIRGVKEINLRLNDFERPLVLPSRLFSCESLVVLKLIVGGAVKFPASVSFPSLKALHLVDITFSDASRTQLLFSGCSVLEKLTLERCNWLDLGGAVTISNHSLQFLKIFDNCYLDDQDKVCQVMIFAKRLRDFNFAGLLSNEFSLYDTPALLNAYFDSLSGGRSRKASYNAYKLLRGLVNTNTLTVASGTISVLGYAEELLVEMPIFHNLTKLDFLSRGDGNLGYMVLLNLLRCSPCLAVLNFPLGFTSISRGCTKYDMLLDPIPPCFLSHLEEITFGRFYGHEDELFVAKILLREALVLKKLIVCFDIGTTMDKRLEVEERLHLLPVGSNSCKIILE